MPQISPRNFEKVDNDWRRVQMNRILYSSTRHFNVSLHATSHYPLL